MAQSLPIQNSMLPVRSTASRFAKPRLAEREVEVTGVAAVAARLVEEAGDVEVGEVRARIVLHADEEVSGAEPRTSSVPASCAAAVPAASSEHGAARRREGRVRRVGRMAARILLQGRCPQEHAVAHDA